MSWIEKDYQLPILCSCQKGKRDRRIHQSVKDFSVKDFPVNTLISPYETFKCPHPKPCKTVLIAHIQQINNQKTESDSLLQKE